MKTQFARVFALLLGSLMCKGLHGSCAARPNFTTSITVATVTPVTGGSGCWLQGTWKDAKGKSNAAPLYTRSASLCGGSLSTAPVKVMAKFDCCDAGGMPPPCSWQTSESMPGTPTGIEVEPL